MAFRFSQQSPPSLTYASSYRSVPHLVQYVDNKKCDDNSIRASSALLRSKLATEFTCVPSVKRIHVLGSQRIRLMAYPTYAIRALIRRLH